MPNPFLDSEANPRKDPLLEGKKYDDEGPNYVIDEDGMTEDDPTPEEKELEEYPYARASDEEWLEAVPYGDLTDAEFKEELAKKKELADQLRNQGESYGYRHKVRTVEELAAKATRIGLPVERVDPRTGETRTYYQMPVRGSVPHAAAAAQRLAEAQHHDVDEDDHADKGELVSQ